MKIEAIFESWLVPDGNYSPLSVGDLVNLSFEMQPRFHQVGSQADNQDFTSIGHGEYRLSGVVLRKYALEGEVPIIVIDAGSMRFYVNTDEIGRYNEGDIVSGEGALLLDHYIWVEYLDQYQNAPNLFYNLRVERITRVKIPDRFVRHIGSSTSMPLRVSLQEAGSDHISQIHTMKGCAFEQEFFILELNSEGLDNAYIPRTFHNY